MDSRIRIGVSSCLLGEKVRYDGGDKLDRGITDSLGRLFRFVPVCPEVGCGLSVPREAMRLEGDPHRPRLLAIGSKVDYTGRMLAWCRETMTWLEQEELCGFIFKKGSPSCAPFRVDVYDQGAPTGDGRGIFAAAVRERFPRLPVEEEGRLTNPEARESFIARVYAYHSSL